MSSYTGEVQSVKGEYFNAPPNGGDMRNIIINGNFSVNQRANTSSSATAFYPADRWVNVMGGGGTSVYTTQQADIGSVVGGIHTKCLQITATTASPADTAGYRLIDQNIENIYTSQLNWGTPQARPATLSFWAYSPRVGIHNITLEGGGFTNSYVAEYTISQANTWTYVIIPIPPATSGTWTGQRSLIVRIYCFMGTTQRTSTPNQWLYGLNASASTNVVNFQTGDVFKITGIQLEAGSVASPYENRSFAQELYLCKRYYQVLVNQLLGATLSASALYDGVVVLYPEMRTNPTLDASKANAYTMNGGPAGTVAIGGTLGGQSVYFQNSANNWTLTTFCKVNAWLYADWT